MPTSKQEVKLDKILELVHRIDTRTALTEQTVSHLEDRVETQNGRVTKLERIGLAVGGGTVVLMLLYGMDAGSLIAKLIGG